MIDTAGTSRRAGEEALLIIAASEQDSDLYWATRFLVPDPIAYLELAGERLLLVRDLELGRARREAAVDRVVSSSPYEEALRERGERADVPRVVDAFLRDETRRSGAGVPPGITVPPSFPFGAAETLRELGWTLRLPQQALFPERAVKTGEEIGHIEACQRAAEECMHRIIGTIARAEPRDGVLWLDGEPLTSERCRVEGHKRLLELGCIATGTIVAGGDAACDPHHRGTGPLPAGATIIIDVFPRSLETRYWGDMTRTVVRGRASEEVRRMHRDVIAAQDKALALIRDGRDGAEVHAAVRDLLLERGHPNEERDGRKTGFIHGTGHGVGLDLHEAPSLGRSPSTLRAGHVVTVEPGLYYPGTGAVRLEELVVVTGDGCRDLNRMERGILEV